MWCVAANLRLACAARWVIVLLWSSVIPPRPWEAHFNDSDSDGDRDVGFPSGVRGCVDADAAEWQEEAATPADVASPQPLRDPALIAAMSRSMNPLAALCVACCDDSVRCVYSGASVVCMRLAC